MIDMDFEQEFIAMEMRLGEETMRQTMELARQQAHLTYSVCDRLTLARCIRDHLTEQNRQDLRAADRYECPECLTLLKNRLGVSRASTERRTDHRSRAVVGTAIEGERRRLRGLWERVEESAGEEKQQALAEFLRALGFPGVPRT